MTKEEKNETKLKIFSDLFKKWGILNEDIVKMKKDHTIIHVWGESGKYYHNIIHEITIHDTPINDGKYCLTFKASIYYKLSRLSDSYGKLICSCLFN